MWLCAEFADPLAGSVGAAGHVRRSAMESNEEDDDDE